MFNANYTYKLPIFTESNGLAHSLLGGWWISGTVVSASGLPWAGSNTPGSGYADTVGLGGGYTNRADLAGKPHYVKAKATVGTNSGYQWVSNTGFSVPTAAWTAAENLGFGNAGRVPSLARAAPTSPPHCTNRSRSLSGPASNSSQHL